MLNIKTVTIVGANGTMARNISGCMASFGDAKVYMMCRTIEKAEAARKKAAKSTRAASIEKKLIPADYSMMGQCIAESDLVLESVTEDMDIKKSVNAQLAPFIKPGTIVCTGTSGFSVNELSRSFPDEIRKRYCALHFFNPPYHMAGCEVVGCELTDPAFLEEFKCYTVDVLHRAGIACKDLPSFVANRIGMQFINQSIQYAEAYKHKGGVDYIDSLLGQYVGRTIGGPVSTANFVGLPVINAQMDNIQANAKSDCMFGTFTPPAYDKKRQEEEAAAGTKDYFFKTVVDEGGKRSTLVYDIESDSWRPKKSYKHPFSEKMIACFRVGDYEGGMNVLINDSSEEARFSLECTLKYILYSLVISLEAAGDYHAADDIMASGFGWAPPLGLIEAVGGKDAFIKLAKERLDAELLAKSNFDAISKDIPLSKLDYRSFLRARY